jgi:hypothetical protein
VCRARCTAAVVARRAGAVVRPGVEAHLQSDSPAEETKEFEQHKEANVSHAFAKTDGEPVGDSNCVADAAADHVPDCNDEAIRFAISFRVAIWFTISVAAEEAERFANSIAVRLSESIARRVAGRIAFAIAITDASSVAEPESQPGCVDYCAKRTVRRRLDRAS